MSLTNPKNVVTEERLSEFYGEILPYLGGMPEVLANKFAKGDLYSTDEKIIGCWTNGKPIYQKILTGTLPSSGSTSNYIDMNVSVDEYIDARTIVQNTSSKHCQFQKMINSSFNGFVRFAFYNYEATRPNTIQIEQVTSTAAGSGNSVMIIVQYTKTTDAANSFKYANETDYSTDEKIIGTWVDGKPLYQKTFCVTKSQVNRGQDATVAHNIANVSDVVYLSGYFKDAFGFYRPLTYFPGLNGQTAWAASFIANNTNIVFQFGTSAYDNLGDDICVTIRYTKTTD